MSGSKVSISTLGEGIGALEVERSSLYAKAVQLSKDQQEILRLAMENVADLSKQHEVIIQKVAALDDSIQALIIGGK